MERRLEIGDDDALRFQQLRQVAHWLILVSIVGLVALGVLYGVYGWSIGLLVIAAQTAIYALGLARERLSQRPFQSRLTWRSTAPILLTGPL